MVLGSPSASLANKLVFGPPEESFPADNGQTDSNLQEGNGAETDGRTHPNGRSMYVEIFEDMLKEVLAGEGKLFVQEELSLFMKYHRLPYAVKYLFSRLCLRKPKWHRMSALKYQAELGDGIRDAIDVLCGRPAEAGQEEQKPVNHNEPNFADLEPTFRFATDPQVKSDPDTDPATHIEPEINIKPEPMEDVRPQVKPSSPRSGSFPIIKVEERDVIDLTFDDQPEVKQPPVAGPSRLPSPGCELRSPSLTQPSPDYSVFADDEDQATLFELLDCLTIDELIDMAKRLMLKLKSKRRDALIDSILRSSSTQSTLALPGGSRKDKGKSMMQSTLPFAPKGKKLTQTVLPFKPRLDPTRTQQDRVREMVMLKLGKCIRLNADVVSLFRRANLVYFRSTQFTPELLTPALLARARKWAFAEYDYKRTPDIWRTRAELLAYEDALRTEAEVDELLDNQWTAAGAGGRGRSSTTMSGTPGLGRSTLTPMTPKKPKSESPIATRGGKGAKVDEDEGQDEDKPRVKNARVVVEIMESVFPQWEALVSAQPEPDEDGRRSALQRFECGHILTRIVCKGAYALGLMHEYERELSVLDALLAQTRWRRARRGRWHDRRAILLTKHLRRAVAAAAASPSASLSQPDPVDAQRALDETALEGVVAALRDEDTHVVFRPMLERRLTALEKRLGVPEAEKHRCVGRLEKAEPVWVRGVRVDRRMELDGAGRVVGGAKASMLAWMNPPNRIPQQKGKETKPEKDKGGGKSIWRGRDGEDVSVEMFALQHYEDKHNFKGFHCEGRIVTTLFGLLFWDVLFAAVPGAFETPYQSAPLDLAEDTFYYARQARADARLAEIEAGQAADVLSAAFDAHQGKMCVGVRWDLFAKEELVGIVKCLEPKALAVICRLMCEDYAARTGGVPDLIVWNEERGEARFVEVKSPNDSLQENQKVWIDVLRQAGVHADICHVYEAGETPKKAKSKGKGAKAPKKTPGKTSKAKAKAKVGGKRKRADAEEDEEGAVQVLDSDASVDYDMLDRFTDDEAESPVKKRPRRTLVEEPESPIARKVARMNSQGSPAPS
ncbi:VRR-NUC domain-containing protein [Trametes gibbosa]|nr:VRR-NUC domain-containing protein [Trametes gibbosa]